MAQSGPVALQPRPTTRFSRDPLSSWPSTSDSLSRKHSQYKCPHRRASHGFREQIRDDPSSDGSFDTCECTLNEPGRDDGCDVGSQSLRKEEDHDPVITSIQSESVVCTYSGGSQRRSGLRLTKRSRSPTWVFVQTSPRQVRTPKVRFPTWPGK